MPHQNGVTDFGHWRQWSELAKKIETGAQFIDELCSGRTAKQRSPLRKNQLAKFSCLIGQRFTGFFHGDTADGPAKPDIEALTCAFRQDLQDIQSHAHDFGTNPFAGKHADDEGRGVGAR